jgi:hypothetical protein
MLNFFKYLLTLTLITLVSSKQYTTNELWRTHSTDYKRPDWAKEVNIIYDEDNKKVLSVEGIIIPIQTTIDNVSWRPSNNAEPYNECGTGKNSTITGVDYQLDKGHLMALSNGGPNIKQNVVPQIHSWQGTGYWRKLEIKIQQIAISEYGWDNKSKQLEELKDTHISKDKVVHWKINIEYKIQCGMKQIECDCQPIEYNGDVYTKDKHYHFEIINNGTYTWDEITPNDEESNLIPWIFVFIVLSIWICVFLFYKKMKYTREIVLLENN